MILSTSEAVDFLAGNSPLNTFIIGYAGAGKTHFIKKLIPKLTKKMCIEVMQTGITATLNMRVS